MVEVSEIGLKHEDDQDELDLGLSIGGSFTKSEKLKPMKKVYGFTVDSKPDGYYADVKENRPASSRSSVSPSFSRDAEPVEAQTKREMHALRRQEAKRKREEKQQQKRGAFIPRNGESVNEFQMGEQPALKKDWRYDYASNVNMNDSDEHMRMLLQQHLRHNALTNPVPLRAVSATAESTSTPVQYVPFTNGGSGFPSLMPCWVPGGGAFGPSGCGSFRPYKGSQSPGRNLSNGSESDHNSLKDGGNGKTASSGSPHCSSSALSEDHSSSRKGVGGTSESRSHSSQSSPEKRQLKGWKSNDTMGHSEHSASSEPVESNKGNSDGMIHTEKSLPSNTAHSGPTRPKEEAMPEAAAEATKPSEKHLPNTGNATPCSVKETKVEMGKPPKPRAQNQNTTTSLPQMPYVSTSGNGPNGKTITGFLYRYTKSEVSIICVCHGSTFSPAEFVQHAGSTGVSRPLKHITVIPSPLG